MLMPCGHHYLTPMKQNYISYMRLLYIFSTLVIRVLKFTIYSTFGNTKCYIAAYNNNCQKERQKKTKRRKEMVTNGPQQYFRLTRTTLPDEKFIGRHNKYY